MAPIPASLWPQASRLLDIVLDLPPPAQADWLDRLKVEQPDLAAVVLALLQAHARIETGDFLDRGAVLAIDTGDDGADEPGEGLQSGDRIGPYQLLHALGSGGMAVVWLAERSDGELARQVALKLPQRFVWRAGMDERFTRERDILARLAHPHIARLYDAGVSAADGPAAGLPYLVLEYVHGTDLVQYCDVHRLPLAQRLALFMQVLDAVQFAHTRLVIHRDLKPANILVDEEGQVQLLDFGVAKLLADASGEQPTQLTQRAGHAFTPDYASPEQVLGEELGTASDVYSLGVVLYELLCGQRPYQLHHTSIAQLEQAIVDVEPAPPNQRLTDSAAGARGTAPRRLQREIRGELDAIVLKALRKKPEQRYGSAAELADDLRRYRDGEPVLAQPHSRMYRLSKLVLRNRIAVLASSLVALALVAGTGVSLWQARIAQRQAQRALAVQAFMTDIFRSNSDAQSDPLRARQTSARELLDIGTKRIDEHLRADPEGRAEILVLLGDMYYDLGLDDQAAELYGRRVAAVRQAFGKHDRRVAQALSDFASQLDQLGRDEDQRRALDEAKSILDRLGEQDSEARAQWLDAMAKANAYSGARAVELSELAVAMYRRHAPHAPVFPHVLNRLGTARWRLDDLAGAEAAFGEALALLAPNPEASISAVITASLTLADIQARLQKPAQAEATYRRALALSLQRNGAQHVDTLHVQARFGSFLHRTSRRAEAWQLLRAADAVVRETPVTPHAARAVKTHLLQALLAEGSFDEAEPIVDWLVAEYRTVAAGKSALLVGCLRQQAEQRLGQSRMGDARGSLAEAWTLLDGALSATLRGTVVNGVALADASIALAQQRGDAALHALSRMVSGPAGVPLWPETLRAQARRADAMLLLGRPAEARASAQGAIDALAASGLRKYYQAIEAEALLALGRALQAEGRQSSACAALDAALHLRLASLGDRSAYVTQTELVLAECLRGNGEHERAARLLAAAHERSARSR